MKVNYTTWYSIELTPEDGRDRVYLDDLLSAWCKNEKKQGGLTTYVIINKDACLNNIKEENYCGFCWKNDETVIGKYMEIRESISQVILCEREECMSCENDKCPLS